MAKTAGRKLKLNLRIEKKVCEIIRKGNFAVTACAVAGISVSTLSNYMERGEQAAEDEEAGKTVKGNAKLCLRFMRAVREAELEVEQKAVDCIQTSMAEGNGNLALKFLQITRPEKWAGRQKVEVTGKGGGAIVVETWVDQIDAALADEAAEKAGQPKVGEDPT